MHFATSAAASAAVTAAAATAAAAGSFLSSTTRCATLGFVCEPELVVVFLFCA